MCTGEPCKQKQMQFDTHIAMEHVSWETSAFTLALSAANPNFHTRALPVKEAFLVTL